MEYFIYFISFDSPEVNKISIESKYDILEIHFDKTKTQGYTEFWAGWFRTYTYVETFYTLTNV